jgi:hypothetical protein
MCGFGGLVAVIEVVCRYKLDAACERSGAGMSLAFLLALGFDQCGQT